MRNHLLRILCAIALTAAAAQAALIVILTLLLPNGTVGVSYSQEISTLGGRRPFSWSITAGALPPGLTISSQSGIISGTPSAAGSFSFTVKVTDRDGDSDSRSLQISVDATAPTVTTSSLPGGTIGTGYSQTLTASGGSGAYTWSITAGSLPSGLTLSPAGTISGTPATGGTANFTVQVMDSANLTAARL